MREDFDFTNDGRRPSAARIIAAWKRAGRPDRFSVTYGETYAEFERNSEPGNYYRPWNDSGNGCRGVDRAAVVRALVAATTARGTDGSMTNARVPLYYKVVRHYFNSDRKRTIIARCTLAVAQAHCSNPATRLAGVYFDGYDAVYASR